MRHTRRGKRGRGKGRGKVSRQGQKRVSDKIAVLRREGKPEREAVGAAYGMERSGGLRAGGKYVYKRDRKRGNGSSGGRRQG